MNNDTNIIRNTAQHPRHMVAETGAKAAALAIAVTAVQPELTALNSKFAEPRIVLSEINGGAIEATTLGAVQEHRPNANRANIFTMAPKFMQ